MIDANTSTGRRDAVEITVDLEYGILNLSFF
jgi:hypothetical protein